MLNIALKKENNIMFFKRNSQFQKPAKNSLVIVYKNVSVKDPCLASQRQDPLHLK